MSNNPIAQQPDANAYEARVRVWLEISEPLEHQLEPLGREAIDRLQLSPGDRGLDIGFGVGSTPFALAVVRRFNKAAQSMAAAMGFCHV